MESRKIQTAEILEKSRELFHVMEKLVVFHRSLCDVLKEEYGHMTSLDTKGLFETSQTKEVLISQIWSAEQLRLRIAEQMSLALGFDPKSNTPTTLLKIAESLPTNESTRLVKTREVLQMLITEARESNQRNMEFADSSLVRIEEMKRNVLGLNNNNNENYSHSGVRQPITEQGGRLLSTEA